jgi:hypothetical protein
MVDQMNEEKVFFCALHKLPFFGCLPLVNDGAVQAAPFSLDRIRRMLILRIMRSATRSLFNRGPKYHSDVVLNWHNNPMGELTLQAEAYFKAGTKLLESFKGGNGLTDFDAYPIIFLYRHALELFVKDILLIGNDFARALGDAKIETPFQEIVGSHRVSHHTEKLRKIFGAVDWKDDDFRCDWSHFLKTIDQIDPDSMTFRYTVNKKGNALLKSHFSFNMDELSSVFKTVLGDFSGACLGLRCMLSDVCEMKSMGYL